MVFCLVSGSRVDCAFLPLFCDSTYSIEFERNQVEFYTQTLIFNSLYFDIGSPSSVKLVVEIGRTNFVPPLITLIFTVRLE